MVTENESMHPNIEFTHQIKVYYYMKRIRVVSAWVVSAKFWGESIRPILMGRFGRDVGGWGTLHT